MHDRRVGRIASTRAGRVRAHAARAARTGLGLALGLDADLGQDDWPAQAADTIVSVVEKVRDRTTGPAITATRAVVFGLLAAMLGTRW